MYYLGIDIGGTTIKGIIIDKSGNAVTQGSAPTHSGQGGNVICESCANLVAELTDKSGLKKVDIAGVGIGCPGVIDSAHGRVVFAGNLALEDFPLAETVKKLTSLDVKLTNDANAAALGEARFGAGSKYKSSILVTLGTGVGGGIVIDGKLFEGFGSAGAEIGHMVIVKDGLDCNCGRRGCWEKYASATALIEQTKAAMRRYKDSAMWGEGGLFAVTGRTAFDYSDTDKAAAEVVKNYIDYLACGIVNLANIFRPEVIMLGGGVSGQGERLTKPLQEILDANVMGGSGYAPVKIATALLGGRAGAYGAAALFMPDGE